MFLTVSLPLAVSAVVWAVLIVTGIGGLIAVASPQLFSRVAAAGNRWVDTSKILAPLDRRVEVDARVMPYSRLFGATVLAAVAFLAFVLQGR